MASKENNWHLSRSVSIGHLVTTAVVAIGAIMYLGDIKENVALNSQNIQNIKEAQGSMFARIEKSMDKMDAKMDRLFDLFHKEQAMK